MDNFNKTDIGRGCLEIFQDRRKNQEKIKIKINSKQFIDLDNSLLLEENITLLCYKNRVFLVKTK